MLVLSHYGFDGKTLVLIAPVPGHCLPLLVVSFHLKVYLQIQFVPPTPEEYSSLNCYYFVRQDCIFNVFFTTPHRYVWRPDSRFRFATYT